MGKKLSIEEFVYYPMNRHFVYTEQEVLDPMLRLTLERGGKQIHLKRIDPKLCVEYVNKPKSSYSWWGVNGSYATNFDSTASFGSDQRLTLGNICDGGDIPFLGTIAAMEIYKGITEGMPGPIKEEIMKALCRDYKVDIHSSYGIKPWWGRGGWATAVHRSYDHADIGSVFGG